MGLDITAYSKLTKLDVLFDADGEPVDPVTREPLHYKAYTKVYSNPDFPGRAEPLEDRACYSYDESMSFRAGSYGGYNAWREQLAELAEYPKVLFERDYGPAELRRDAAAWTGKADGKPFLELVNFSDCEGTIGSIVAAKLAKDFAEWDDRAKATGDGIFYDRYTNWRKAFEMAADGGAVDFH